MPRLRIPSYQTTSLRPFLTPLWMILSLVSCLFWPLVAAASSSSKTSFITIPLSALDVDQATATISVLQEPQSPISSLLSACQSNLPEELNLEEKGLSEDVKTLCQMAESFTRKYLDPPSHNFDAKRYVITVPLKATHQGIEALTWNTSTLDDAMTFVKLLQGGKLKALKAYTSMSWSATSPEPCVECPIKELVFRADAIKEQVELLRGQSNEVETTK